MPLLLVIWHSFLVRTGQRNKSWFLYAVLPPFPCSGRTSDLPELLLSAVLHDHLHQWRWCMNQTCCLHTWVPGALSAYGSTLIGYCTCGQGEAALFAGTFMHSLYCCMFCGNWVRNLELGVVSSSGWEGLAKPERQSYPSLSHLTQHLVNFAQDK